MFVHATDFFQRCSKNRELVQLYYEGQISRDADTRIQCASYVKAVSSLQERIANAVKRIDSCEHPVAKSFLTCARSCVAVQTDVDDVGPCDLTNIQGVRIKVTIQTETEVVSFRFKQEYWAQLALPAFEFVNFFQRAVQHSFRSAKELEVVFLQDEAAFDVLVRTQ